MPITGIHPISFDVRDFTTREGVMMVNDFIEKLIVQVNTLAGLHGPIELSSSINMQGNTIQNLGTPQNPTDAIHQQSAQQQFSASVLQPALDAMGSSILQTTRRLNDQNQQESYSTFMNSILNVPPGSNTSTITVTNLGGGNTQVSITAGTYTLADKSTVPYSARTDTFANPGAGINVYYYYLRKSDRTLQFVGPFTADLSINAIQANTDGRGAIGKATINAAGGGTGGGGGNGGCLEIGTPFHVPSGKKWHMEVLPCNDWLVVELSDGRKLVAARSTEFAVFKKVQDLQPMVDQLIDESGQTVPILSVTVDNHQSYKMKMTVQGRLYLGNGVWLSNAKILQ